MVVLSDKTSARDFLFDSQLITDDNAFKRQH